jgi:hypothetical protein
MFVEAQRKALIQAAEVADEVKPITSTEQAIAAIRDRLAQRGRLEPQACLAAKDTADRLQIASRERFGYLTSLLRKEMSTKSAKRSCDGRVTLPTL